MTYTLDASKEPDEFRDVLPIKFGTVTTTDNQEISDAGLLAASPEILSNDDFLADKFEGDFQVNNLQNGQQVNMAFGLRNKFFWVTQLTPLTTETPLDIEELLQKEACYLFTAGFGGEHWLIDHYKNFRDQVLLKSKWGRAFVSFYYRTAPKTALSIYQRPWLRKILRGTAYLLYPLTKPLVDHDPFRVKMISVNP